METDSPIFQPGGGADEVVRMLAHMQLRRKENDWIFVGNAKFRAHFPAMFIGQSRALHEADIVDRVGHQVNAILRYAHCPVERCVRRTNRKNSAQSAVECAHKWLARQKSERWSTQSKMRFRASEYRHSSPASRRDCNQDR